MTVDEKIALMEARMIKLEGRRKNSKCPGVKKKLIRQLRNAKAQKNG